MKRAIVLVLGLVLVSSGGADAAAKLTTKTCYRPSGSVVKVTSKKPCSSYGMTPAPPKAAGTSVQPTAPTPVDSTVPATAPAPTAPPTTLPASPGATVLATFGGSGKLLTQPFAASNGLVVFEFSHTGRSNFIVHLLNGRGERTDYLFNEIGPISKAQTFSVVAAGSYVVQVDADGAWTGTATQYRPTGAFPTVGLATGRGQFVVGPIVVLGPTVVTATHDGRSNFIVHAVTPDGRKEYLFNEIGPFSGQTTFTLQRSYAFFAVQADGNWTVDFKPFGT